MNLTKKDLIRFNYKHLRCTLPNTAYNYYFDPQKNNNFVLFLMDSAYSEGKRGKVHITVAQMDAAFIGVLDRSLSFGILLAYIRFCVTRT